MILLKLIFIFSLLPFLAQSGRPIDAIKNVIIIVMENWSFDGMFGLLKGVDGVTPENYIVQVDKNDVPYGNFTRPTLGLWPVDEIDTRFPEFMPNEWLNLTKYVPNRNKTKDLVHRFYTHQYQINKGKLNKFYAYTDATALTMSYIGNYDDLPFQKIAEEHTVCTRYFQGHFGGSFLSHFWIVANSAPEWPSTKPIPPGYQSNFENGSFNDAQLTIDGKYAVNTIYSENTPFPPSVPLAKRLPPQTKNNIGDELSKKGVDWRWYAGGWDKVMANPNVSDELFQYHHQPFAYFAKYGDNTEGRKQHLFDEKNFYSDLDEGKLPPVSWVKFYGSDNEHPGYSDLVTGNKHLANIINKIKTSSIWNETLVIVTFDEFGGRFDHVVPPIIDEFGPGSRIGTVLISPFTKKSFLDNTSFYTHDSLNKFLSLRFNITPFINTRVQNAFYFENSFDWNLTGLCCPTGYRLKEGKACNFDGACQDCCEESNDSKGLFFVIVITLFIVAAAGIFLVVAFAIVGCRNTQEQPYLSIQNTM